MVTCTILSLKGHSVKSADILKCAGCGVGVKGHMSLSITTPPLYMRKLHRRRGRDWYRYCFMTLLPYRSELPGLRQRVVEAICGVERRLSAMELDIKLHNLIHLVDSVKHTGKAIRVTVLKLGQGTRAARQHSGMAVLNGQEAQTSLDRLGIAGPLHATSMFMPESTWGKLGRLAHSKGHLESGMLFAALDLEVTFAAQSQLGQVIDLAEEENTKDDRPTAWDPEEFYTSTPTITAGRPVAARYTISHKYLQQLHRLYQRSGITGQVKETSGQLLRSVCIGTVRLEKRSWFLCKPVGASALMRFGQVEELLLHTGPDGTKRPLLKAKWYTAAAASTQIDTKLRCPVVTDKPEKQKPWCFAGAVVPWACWAMKHPTSKKRFLMLARHWHVTRFLPPYPEV